MEKPFSVSVNTRPSRKSDGLSSSLPLNSCLVKRVVLSKTETFGSEIPSRLRRFP